MLQTINLWDEKTQVALFYFNNVNYVGWLFTI